MLTRLGALPLPPPPDYPPLSRKKCVVDFIAQAFVSHGVAPRLDEEPLEGRNSQKSPGSTSSMIDGGAKSPPAIKVLNNEGQSGSLVEREASTSHNPLVVAVKDQYSNSECDSSGVKGLLPHLPLLGS